LGLAEVETMNHKAKGALILTAICAAACGDTPPSAPSNPPTASTTTTTAPVGSTTSTTTSTSAPSTQVVRQANFQSANGYTTEGSARILMSGGSYSLELGSNFRASQSPALDVRLCNDSNCRGASLELGTLQRFSGAQTYAMPNDGSAYSQVVIYCRAVQLAFGFGTLR